MPLIDCPDCGERVSTEAVSCPECGRPIKEYQGVPLLSEQTPHLTSLTSLTSEETKEKYKSHGCMSGIVIVISIVIMYVGFSALQNYTLTGLGVVMFLGGLYWFVINRITIRGNHD